MLIGEGRADRGEQLRETIVQPWGPGSTSRDTHNNIFELFIELKPQQMDLAQFILKRPEGTREAH